MDCLEPNNELKLLAFIVFDLNGSRFALDAYKIEQVVQMVEIMHLPNESEIVAGVINFHGNVTPVLNLRNILGMEHKEPDLGDKLIIAQHDDHLLALWADSVEGLFECPKSDKTCSKDIYQNLHFIDGVIACDENMIPLLDINLIISSETLEDIHAQEEINGE